MQGVLLVIDQLGQNLMQRDQMIAVLQAQVQELQAQLDAKDATNEPEARSGDA